jgi:hypothetical protein
LYVGRWKDASDVVPLPWYGLISTFCPDVVLFMQSILQADIEERIGFSMELISSKPKKYVSSMFPHSYYFLLARLGCLKRH